MATPFKFDTKKHGNINDSALKDLPLGKHNYVITKITFAPIKADKTGRRKHLVVELRHSEGGKFTQFLEIHPKDKTENEQIRARIAAEEFNAYVQAAGFEGVLTPAKFKALYNKVIGIETTKTKNKASGKEYVNVNQIVKDGWSDEDLSSLGATSVDEDDDADDDEEEEETPAQKKKRLAAEKRKKAAAKKKAAEEEEEDDDDEDDDSDEEEDDDEDDDDSDDEEEEEDDDDEDDPFA